MKKKLFIVVILILNLIGCSQARMDSQTPEMGSTGEARFARFEAELENIRQLSMIPGMSAAVLEDQQLVWARGFGYADLESRVPAGPDTPYQLASVTKPFAAILLMQLVETGDLDLDNPISKYGIQIGPPGTIQVRHLLSHTSNGEPPGAEFQYNGDRFAELDLVFKPASGQSFGTRLNERILEPLEMDHTAPSPISRGDGLGSFALWVENQRIYRQQASAYQLDQDYNLAAGQCSEFFMPAAGLISTVTDLAKFDIALDRDRFLLPETKAQMFAPTLSTSGQVLPYGLGWFSQEYAGKQMIWHYGWQPGCSSTLYLKFPGENLTFLVLANSDNLSRPYQLGSGEVLPLDSTFALAFYKAFVFEPEHDLTVPRIDWEGSPQEIVAQLETQGNPDVRQVLERELLAYRRLFQSVGRFDQAERLMDVHAQVFPNTSLQGYAALLEPVAQPWSLIRMPLMTHLVMVIFIIVVLLSWMVGWPVARVVARLRKRKSASSGLPGAGPGLGRHASLLAFLAGLLFVVVLFLYVAYLSRFPMDGMLEWSGSTWLVKTLLGAALLSGFIALGLLVVTARIWRPGNGSIPRRIYNTLIALAGVMSVVLWYQLGFFDWLG